MEQHKTKVIAIRVTQEQYIYLNELCDELGNISFAKLFEPALQQRMAEATSLIKRRQKAAEARAKRQAKKEAASGL
jgi:hypothetical protein